MLLVTFLSGMLLGMPVGAWIIVIVAIKDNDKGGHND